MKIIQIVGYANSGKTTFIKNLIPELRKLGSVAVIKHLGEHDYVLDAGRDTTEFFEAGADTSIGIDSEKTVIALRKNSLDESLILLSQMGMKFVIIEGFKKRSFPKIAIGNITVEKCILKNPSGAEVIAHLDLFENFQVNNESRIV